MTRPFGENLGNLLLLGGSMDDLFGQSVAPKVTSKGDFNMTNSIVIASAAALMALSSASIASAQSSPFDPCMVEARAYCLPLHSGDRLAFFNCVQEEYAACIGALTTKVAHDQKVYLRRCKG